MSTIEGPNPAELDDDQIADACYLIGRIALDVLGLDEHADHAALAAHDPVAAWVYRGLAVLFAVLTAETERRTAAEVAKGLEQLARHLGGP